MTITLHWWYMPIALFVFPFVFRIIRPAEHTGGYFGSIDFEGMLIGVISWALAIGILIGGLIK